MPAAPPPPPAVWPAAGVQQGRSACQALLRETLVALVPQPGATGPLPITATRGLWLVDRDFADWPLDEPAVLHALSAWLRLPGRRLVLLGEQPADLVRSHARFARWRRDFGHAVDVWAPLDGDLPRPLCGLLGDGLWLQRLDATDWRLRVVTDRQGLRALHTQLADFLQRCAPSWPVTTLGL